MNEFCFVNALLIYEFLFLSSCTPEHFLFHHFFMTFIVFNSLVINILVNAIFIGFFFFSFVVIILLPCSSVIVQGLLR